ncbi:MAG: hypothetical protein ABUL60_10490 [Myxococcales bacterium]
MLKSNLLFCWGLALIGTACNHENDRAMTPANGTTSGEPNASDYNNAGTQSGDPRGSDGVSPDPGSGSGMTPGSGSGTTGGTSR